MGYFRKYKKNRTYMHKKLPNQFICCIFTSANQTKQRLFCRYRIMKEIDINVLGQENPFDLIGKEWMLITAGTKESFNTMTASWGGLGWLWNRPVAFIFVRPERYTHDFIEKNGRLTLSFYPEEYRQALQICGSKSGRDCDKVAEAGLSPVEIDKDVMTFSQARLTIQGRKVFQADMKEADFIDRSILQCYSKEKGGFHTVYVVEIEKIFQND